MDWQSGRRSDNVEDVRGGGAPAPRGRKGPAIGGGMVLLVVVIGALMGKSPGEIIQLVGNVQQQQAQAPAPQQQAPQAGQGINDTGKDFVKSVLGSTEDVWNKIFAEGGERYPQPKLVLFRDGVDSACGFT